MTCNLTKTFQKVLRDLPYPSEWPARCPRWTRQKTIACMLEQGLIEEPQPGFYRRTVAGHAAWNALCWGRK